MQKLILEGALLNATIHSDEPLSGRGSDSSHSGTRYVESALSNQDSVTSSSGNNKLVAEPSTPAPLPDGGGDDTRAESMAEEVSDAVIEPQTFGMCLSLSQRTDALSDF